VCGGALGGWPSSLRSFTWGMWVLSLLPWGEVCSVMGCGLRIVREGSESRKEEALTGTGFAPMPFAPRLLERCELSLPRAGEFAGGVPPLAAGRCGLSLLLGGGCAGGIPPVAAALAAPPPFPAADLEGMAAEIEGKRTRGCCHLRVGFCTGAGCGRWCGCC